MTNVPAENPLPSSDDDRARLLALLRSNPENQLASLSADQQRLWLLQGLDATVPLHVFAAAQVDGPLDAGRLREAAEEVVRGHDATRSAFIGLGRSPVRMAAPNVTVPMRFLTDEGTRDEDFLGAVQRAADEDARHPFDLRTAPLARVSVVSAGAERHALLVTMHQLVADHYSPTLFIRECLTRYAAATGELPLPADGPPVHAARAPAGGELAERLRYWRAYLEDMSVLDLPADRPRPAVRTHRGAVAAGELQGELLERLQTKARDRGTSLTELTLAAFQMLLSWYSGQDDVAVGAVVDSRPAGQRGQLGRLAHTTIVRTRFTGDPDVLDVLARVSEDLAAGLERPVALATLIAELKPVRDLSRTPLFQAGFVVNAAPARQWRAGPLTGRTLHIHPGLAMLDLTLLAHLGDPECVHLSLEYNADLFLATTAQQIFADLLHILACLAATSPRRLSQVVVTTPPASLIQSAAVHGIDSDDCLHDLVLAQARRTPDAVAVCAGTACMTYGTLERDSARVASYLQRCDVGPEVTVGVSVAHEARAIVALLGVLRAGGAYVPLDPHLPVERAQLIARDAGVRLVLAGAPGATAPPGVPLVPLEDVLADSAPARARLPRPRPDNLAYVIYTSGSTGRPKGVAVAHRSIVNNLAWRQRTWPLGPQDRALQSYSFSFDPSMWATWWPLLAGACVVLSSTPGHFDSLALARLMVEERVTVYGAAPSLHSILLEEPALAGCDSLRYVFSGGETLDGPLQRLLHHRLSAMLVNVYGPTEATVDCSHWSCPRVAEPEAAPIGHPVAGTSLYVLNRHGAATPVGVPGEIHVGGVALARGYLGDPALTAQKFVPDPFGGHGARMYRTGDLGRQRPSHGLEFIGRTDDQVKVRGFRIELDEITRALLAHPALREAAVLVRRRSSSDARILAYVVPQPGSEARCSHADLAAFVETRLPKYMVPDVFVTLPTLPRTSSGKVDRQALPPVGEPATATPLRGPRDILETEIARIVTDVLGLESLGIDANLFDLGCNSLLIARIASRLSNAYSIELPVQRMFDDPSVAGVAALVDGFQRAGGRDPLAVPWTLAQLEAEAELEPGITAQGLPSYAAGNIAHVLVTGGTGYLGAFIIERLLQAEPLVCHCLVRAPDEQAGFERIRSTMKGYHIWRPEYASRIRPVPGDIAAERLGLGREAFERLAREVDAIYHCAALVNFVYPYSALRAPNVLGTREVLRLASTTKVKAVHYVSTVDVLLGAHMERPFAETDEVLRRPREVPDGYARSKWVAEKMLAHAQARGIPTCVFRPGLVMGHTRTGATQTNDYLLIGLKGYLDLGVLPEPGILIDFVTVDFVAQAIVHLSRQAQSIGRYFHIWNPRPQHMARAYDWIRSFGYVTKLTSRRALRDKVLKEVDVSNVLYPFVPIFRAMREDPPLSPHHPSIYGKVNVLEEECAQAFAGLAGSGIECAPLSEHLAHLCFAYLVSIGFLPEPHVQAASVA
jgi:amino acid adenylation domain-containing protein/thioester reductase-like protein